MATPHKWKDVIIAIAEGTTVQWGLTDPQRDKWIDFDENIHSSPIDSSVWVKWRIKPESEESV